MAVCAAVCACLVPGAQGAWDLKVGIVDDAQLLYGHAKQTIADYKKLHAEVVPITLVWGGRNGVANAKPVHPWRPGDPAYDWSIYDQLVRRATAAGMQVVFTIYGTPSWANGGKKPNVGPRRKGWLTEFAHVAALRYSGHFRFRGIVLPRVRYWIAWNEPNNPDFLSPQWEHVNGHWLPAAAIEYARMCNAIYAGVHSTKIKGERVACGATSPRGNNYASSGRPSMSPITFLRAVKRYGLKTFDAWAHHPYPSRPSERPNKADPRGGAVELGNIDSLTFWVTHLYGKKPIWVTEYAYQTNPPHPFFGVPYKLQARYLKEAFYLAQKNARISMMFWFMLKDDTSPNGWASGLITTKAKKKPSWWAFKTMALKLRREQAAHGKARRHRRLTARSGSGR